MEDFILLGDDPSVLVVFEDVLADDVEVEELVVRRALRICARACASALATVARARCNAASHSGSVSERSAISDGTSVPPARNANACPYSNGAAAAALLAVTG